MKRRLLSILLALTMLLSMVPVSVFATDNLSNELPNATVNELDLSLIDEYHVYGGKFNEGGDPIPVQIAMEFIANDSKEEAEANLYGDYTTDFFITLDGIENEEFIANGCYLVGNYGEWGWIKIPLDGTVLKEDTYPVITSYDIDFKYVDICSDVMNFKCGIYIAPEILDANPNLTVTLELGLSEDLVKAKNCEYITVGEYTYGPVVNYVSLGDSMTNGYGLDGYNHNSGVEDYGTGAYPNQFAEWLEDEYNCFVNDSQLAMSGIRTEDIHWLLEFDYNSEEQVNILRSMIDDGQKWDAETWNTTFGCGDYWTLDQIANHTRTEATFAHIAGVEYKDGTVPGKECEQHGALISEFPTTVTKKVSNDVNNPIDTDDYTRAEMTAVIAKYYQEKVASADVISLSAGNGNIGVFGFGRILEAIGFDDSDTIKNYKVEDLLRECEPDLKADLMLMIDELKPVLQSKIANEDLVNVGLYIAVSLALNYAGTVDRILQMNPDVQIILVPVMNTFGTEDAEGVEGTTLGTLMQYVVEPINKFIAGLPAYMQATNNEIYKDAEFFYAQPGEVECMVETYTYPITNATVRDRFVESIVGWPEKAGMLWGLLNGDSKTTDDDMVCYVSVDEIAAYEEMSDAERLAFAASDSKKATSIAMYLAFEKAIVNGTDNAVTLESVLGLGNGMGDVFGPIMDAFYAKVATDAQVEDENGVSKLDSVAAFIAANSKDLLTDDQVKNLVAAKDEAVLDAVIYGIVAEQASVLASNLIGTNVTLTADAVKALCSKNIDVQDTALYELIASLSNGQLDAVAVQNLDKNGLYNFVASMSNDQLDAVAVQNLAENGVYEVAAAQISVTLNKNLTATDVENIYNNSSHENYNMVVGVVEALKGIYDQITSLKNVVDNLATVRSKIVELQNGAKTLNEVPATAELLCTLLVMPETLGTVVSESEGIKSLLALYGRCVIGNGLGAHPSQNGHDELGRAVIAAYEDGYTVQDETIKNLKEAYATAYDLAYSMGKITEVQGYMDVAIESVKAGWNAAMDYVPEDPALDGVKTALMAEYGATINTLVTIRDMIGDPAKMGDYESAKDSVLALESELWIHLENLKNLSLEIGFVADPYIADAMIAAENYSDLITQIARDTFDAAVEAGTAFADEYYAWVDEVSAAVALFDQDLAAAVEKFLTETPEEGIFIMGEYGSQMLSVLVKAAIASEDVYTVFSALGYALSENGEDIYNAIATSENAQILLEQVLALKDQLLAHLNISDIYHYDETLNTILGELTTASCELLKAVVVAVYAEGNTDSEVAASIGAIFTALNDALVELGEAGEYGSELTALVSGMGADLLAMLVENGGELDAAMIAVYNQTVNHVVTNLAKVDAKVAEVVGYVLTVVLPEIAETVAEQHDQAWIVIQGQLDTLMGMAQDVQKTVGEVVAELNQKLDQLKNHIQDESNAIVSEVEAALNELKALLAQAEGLSQDVLDEINAAIAEVEAALNELKKVIAGNFESIYDMLDAMAAAKAELLSALNNLIDVLHRDASNIHSQMIAQLTTVKDHVNCIVDNRDAIVSEIASWLLEELVEALPTIDAKLYEFFYNNPDMVISFFEEYGEIFAENYEVALVVLGYIAYTYGPDAAEWVMENPEEALSQFVAWYEAYGDKAWEMVVVYLAELGIIDAIEGEINNATVQVKAAADKLCQILTENGEALKAELDKIAADTQKQIEELEKQLDDLYAQLENAVESDKATILAQIADVQAKLDALNADLYTKLMEAAAKVDAELPGKIQAAYNALVDALVAAAKEYGADVDQWLYDYLYENPAKVIGFFMEYGDSMVNFLANYTEEIVTVLGALVLYLGDDVAEFVMNYPEELFAAMVQWAETYGEKAWDMVVVYLTELGIVDAIEGEVKDAAAKVKAAAEELCAILTANAEALKAELDKIAADTQKQIEELEKQLDDLYAQLENAVESEKAGILAQIADIQAKLDALNADLYTKLMEAAAKVDAELPGKIQAAYNALVDALVAAAKEYGADVDQWLYDYLYENPAKVIGFFMEYGDSMVNFLANYTEEIVTVLGALVLYLGDDVAEFVMNYPEELFAAMVQWAETYGEETWAMILVYLNELGVIDAAQDTLENAYAQLTDLITAANGQVEEAIASVQAQIEAQIKKLEEAKAALEAELARLQAELENASGEAKDQIEQAIAQVEKAIEAIENSIEILEGKIAELVEIAKDIDAAVQDVFDAIAMIEKDIHGAIAALQDALRDLADAIGEVKEFVEDINDAVAEELGKVSDAIDAIVDISEKTVETVSNIIAGTIEVIETVETIIGQVQTGITEAADALEDAIETLDKNVFNAYYAVLVKCEYGDAMTYVALGGATVADGGYVEAIGEYIEANQVVNAGEAMAYADQAAYVAENAEAIADAGFITYQMDANEIVRALVDVFIAINVGDSYTDPDWAEYVDVDELTNTAEEVKGEVQAIKVKIAEYLDDETLAQIAQMEAEIIAKLEGMFDEELVEQAKPYVEYLVYKLYAYAVETSDAIDAVKAANSEAPVVLVGMYNTLNGVCLKVGGQETDLGEFFQYVIDVVDVYNLIYAIVSGNVTFIDVSEAAVDSAVIDVDAMLAMYAYVDAITNDVAELTEKIQNLTAQMNPGDLDGVTQILNAIQELRDEIDEILLKADTMITKIEAEFANIYTIIANTANEEGHAYIAEQIKNALIIVDHTAGEAVQENVVEATCKAEGSYDEVVYCSVCGEELSRESKAIDKTDHAPDEAVQENVVPATCEDDGSYDEVIYCSVCSEELSREAKTSAKLGHRYTAYEYIEGSADCFNDGSEIAYCDNGCGTTHTRTAEGSKLEHEFTKYVYNDDATCNQNGTETAICDHGCGEKDTREAENTKLEHSFITYVSNGDATCQNDGTETASCDHGCGDKDTRKAANTKLEHSYTTYVSNGDATCFADGTEVAECDYGCGTKDARTDEGSKLTHSFTTYTSNGDATCFADGAETAYCDHGCGATDTRTDEGSKLTHSFTTYTSNGDATCFNDGTETAICDNDCGFTDTRRDEGSKLGHSYSTYTSNGDATCVADGTETAACDHGCGFTDTRRDEGSKLDHVFTDYKSNEDAKCLVDGTETATCDLGCGTKDTRTDEGSKLGHQWDEGVVTTEPTATKNGIITYTCSVCQATKTDIAAKTGVIRIYGADRYKTAFKAADTLKETLGVEKFEYIVVASGTEYADALSGSYLANQKNAPILLVRNRNQELNDVKEYIKANLVSGGTVYLLGGEKAVPKAMESGLDGFVVKRLGGATRYDTNLAILKEAGVGTEDILIATGKDFADSLSASAVNKPILLVKDNLNDAQKNFLSGLSGNKIYIIGGNNAVHTRIENALKTYGSVTRIGGATRYDTSVNIAKEFFPNADSAVLVYGKNFPDGLTGGVLASHMNAPVILAAKGKETQAVKYITTAGIKTGAVMGGTILISDGIVKNAFSMGNNDQIIVK